MLAYLQIVKILVNFKKHEHTHSHTCRKAADASVTDTAATDTDTNRYIDTDEKCQIK